MARDRRSHAGSLIAGGVVIAAGFGVALVEALKFPRGSIWLVVGGAIALVALIRALTRRPR